MNSLVFSHDFVNKRYVHKYAVIPNTNDAYIITRSGTVFSRYKQIYKKGRIGPIGIVTKKIKTEKTQFLDAHGYFRVCIKYPHEKRKSKKVPIHTLILESFVGPRPYGFEAAHLNGKRTDNRLKNLKWVSRRENNQMKVLHGTDLRGSKHPNSKLTHNQMVEIKKRKLAGESSRALGKEFGCSHHNIDHIRDSRPWIKA